MILSNQMRPDGKPAGLNDAGQGWHTDMSYSRDIALANVLHAQAVPVRNGKSVGETQFRNMHAAYDELPRRSEAHARRPHRHARLRKILGSDAPASRLPPRQADRGAETPQTARLAAAGAGASPDRPQDPLRQPRLHNVDRRHGPATRATRSWTTCSVTRSVLDFLYAHRWAVGDVLMWDNIGTVHNAVADYTPTEPRTMRRVQGDADAGLSGARRLTCRTSPASALSSPAALAASAWKPCAPSWTRAATSSWPTRTKPR